MATFQRRLLAATCKTKENICVTLKRARTGASIFTEPSLENKVFVAVAIDFVPLSGRDSTICLRVTPINIILGNLLLHRLVPYLSLGGGRGGGGSRPGQKPRKIEDRQVRGTLVGETWQSWESGPRESLARTNIFQPIQSRC